MYYAIHLIQMIQQPSINEPIVLEEYNVMKIAITVILKMNCSRYYVCNFSMEFLTKYITKLYIFVKN